MSEEKLTVVPFKPRENDQAEIVRGLEELLVKAKEGKCTGYVCFAAVDDEFLYLRSAGVSLTDAIAWAQLMANRAMRHMIVND